MTGREKINSAFSPDGASQIPVVICYERIFIRDHWSQLTDCPWYYWGSPNDGYPWDRWGGLDIEHELQWRREAIKKINQNWFRLPTCRSKKERENLELQIEGEKAFEFDKTTGSKREIPIYTVGKWAGDTGYSYEPDQLPKTHEEVDKSIPPDGFDPDTAEVDGRVDLAKLMLNEFGEECYPFEHVLSPLWSCYELWGFENLMMMIATKKDLIKYACQKYLEQSIRQLHDSAVRGCAGIWIEECFTDMISPACYLELTVPFLRPLVEEIRSLGMHSIYYFSGNPNDRLEQILEVGSDAVSFEESKKDFSIDIETVVEKIQGRCAVLGNLDSIGILQDGSEEQLREEIKRQIDAGRRNNNKFVMSLGSPVTPQTSVERVRLYCDMAKEYGRGR